MSWKKSLDYYMYEKPFWLVDFLYDCFGDFSIMNLSKLLVFLIIIICFHCPLAKEDYWTQIWCYSFASNFCLQKSIDSCFLETSTAFNVCNQPLINISNWDVCILYNFRVYSTIYKQIPLGFFKLVMKIITVLIDFIVLKLKHFILG